MYQKYFSKHLAFHQKKHCFSSGPHFVWPDVAIESKLTNSKDFTPEFLLPIQDLIANELSISSAEQINFIPNVETLLKNLSSYLYLKGKQLKILTTDSEKHPMEYFFPSSLITKIPTMPFDNFSNRLITQLKDEVYDIVFLSHVFFNSGMVLTDIEKIANLVNPQKTILLLDIGLSFMRVPVNLSKITSNVFYLSELNKNEICFLISPPNIELYPQFLNTINIAQLNVPAISKLHKTLQFYFEHRLNADYIQKYIRDLQIEFRNKLIQFDHSYLCEKNIISVNYNNHGHFLSFALPSYEHAQKLHTKLLSLNIMTDVSEKRLHFGFGLHHSKEDLDLNFLKNL